MMTEQELTIGTHVMHSLHGVGYVINVTLVNCDIIFERGGKVSFSKQKVLEDLELLDSPEETSDSPKLTLEEFEEAIIAVLDKYKIGRASCRERV